MKSINVWIDRVALNKRKLWKLTRKTLERVNKKHNILFQQGYVESSNFLEIAMALY
jgi:hypothetical protein